MLAKRKMFSVLGFIFVTVIFVSCLFALTACSTSKNSDSNNHTIPSEENDVPGAEHYEIDLSMQNFSEFIKYTITETVANSTNKTGNHYELQGVLRFAYYKNVVVTLSATYQAPSWQGGEQKTFQFSVVLDAAGDCKFDTNNPVALEKLGWSSYKPGTTSQIKAVAVTGKVIFNI